MMKIHVAAIILLISLTAGLARAIPPLTPSQEEQVKTANDQLPGTDEPALYPLMENALSWQTGDESGAQVPDYAAILNAPAENRGKLFLIEGQYAGGARLEGDPVYPPGVSEADRARLLKRSLKPRSRTGPWSGKLQEWGVVTNLAKDELVMVYVVDPPLPIDQMPAMGTKVRLVGRFFKILRDKDAKGNPTQLLAFVAKTGTLGTPGQPVDAAQTSNAMKIAGFIGVIGAFYLIFRVYRAVRGARKDPFRLHKDETPEEREARIRRMKRDEEGSPPLPSDPVEALAELERRKDASAQNDGEKPA